MDKTTGQTRKQKSLALHLHSKAERILNESKVEIQSSRESSRKTQMKISETLRKTQGP